MEDAIVKFSYETKELRNLLIRAALEDDVDFTDTEDKEVMLMTRVLRCLDATSTIMIEQAKKIDEINKNLNTVLENQRLAMNLLLQSNERKVTEEET